MAAQPSQVWPVSVAGWVALAAAMISLVAIIFGWGRFFGKLKDIIDLVAKISVQVEAIADKTMVIEHTLWGPKGDNGLSSEFKTIRQAVWDIQDRNTKIDAIRAREAGAKEVGHEGRVFNRRREDRIIHEEE